MSETAPTHGADPTTGGPLAGIRVLDFSRVLAGPYCGRMLSDLGADVVKIEPPEGDLTRFAEPKVNSISLYYAQQNTGKRNVSIDLHRPEGIDLVLGLAEHSDVVLENSRPGVMDRLGIGYDAVAARNPRVVYASITGYGQRGPWSQRRAYAVLIHAEAGLDDTGARLRRDAGDPGAAAVQDGTSHADVYAGLHAASAILAALLAREHTGSGQHIDVAMADTLLHTNDFAHWDLAGAESGDRWAALAPAYSPIVCTGAGVSITIAGDPVAPGIFERYVAALDRPDLLADPRFAPERRRLHRRALLDIVEKWVLGFDDVDRLEEVLDSHDLPIGRLRTVADLAATDWARERGIVAQVPDRGSGTVPVPQAPWRFSSLPVGVHGEPAYRGEHNREVLGDLLGLDDVDVDALAASGVISSRMPRRAPVPEPSFAVRALTGSESDLGIGRRLVREYVEATAMEMAAPGEEPDLASMLPHTPDYHEFAAKFAVRGATFLIAECEGGVAGGVGVSCYGETTCEMNRLWVRPEMRRRGIGWALVAESLARAAALGYRKMVLDVLPWRTGPIALYRSLGFTETDPVHEYDFHMVSLAVDL